MERPEEQIEKTGVERQIIVRPEAEAEVQQAFDWYEAQNPFAYTVAKVANIRRALVRKFQYALFYLVDDDAIVVIAVFHVKRQPID